MYVIILATVVLLGFALRRELGDVAAKWLRRKPVAADAAPEASSREDVLGMVERVLRGLQVDFRKRVDEDSTHYEYTFQAGNFILSAYQEGERPVRLLFPGVCGVSLDDIDAMRIVCNEVNSHNLLAQAVYSVAGEENEVYCHVVSRLPGPFAAPTFRKMLEDCMEECFVARRLVHERLDVAHRQAETAQMSDFEYALNRDRRANALLEASELLSDEGQLDCGPAEGVGQLPLTLGRWLAMMGMGEAVRLQRLQVGVEGVPDVTDPAAISAYQLGSPLFGDDGRAECVRKEVVLLLHFLPAGSPDDAPPALLSLVLQAVRDTAESRFYRLTYTLPQMVAGMTHSPNLLAAAAHPVCGSMMLAVDRAGEAKAMAEFRYMWGEAQDKVAAGKAGELTEEQQLVAHLARPDLGYDLYWGYRFMREERYAEAALHFERAWRDLNGQMLQATSQRKKFFYHVSYLTGFCFFKLSLWKTAYYYLQAAEPSDNVAHCMALINCLVSARDVRADKMVGSIKSSVENRLMELTAEETEIPPQMNDFYNFLRRREVYLSVRHGFLESGEKECRRMLKETANEAFALKELELIKKLRESGRSVPSPEEEPPL